MRPDIVDVGMFAAARLHRPDDHGDLGGIRHRQGDGNAPSVPDHPVHRQIRRGAGQDEIDTAVRPAADQQGCHHGVRDPQQRDAFACAHQRHAQICQHREQECDGDDGNQVIAIGSGHIPEIPSIEFRLLCLTLVNGQAGGRYLFFRRGRRTATPPCHAVAGFRAKRPKLAMMA